MYINFLIKKNLVYLKFMKLKIKKVKLFLYKVFLTVVVIPFKKVLKLKDRITNILDFFSKVEIYFLIYFFLNNSLDLKQLFLSFKAFFIFLYKQWNNLSDENKELVLKFFYSLFCLIMGHLMYKYSFLLFFLNLNLANSQSDNDNDNDNFSFFQFIGNFFLGPYFLLVNLFKGFINFFTFKKKSRRRRRRHNHNENLGNLGNYDDEEFNYNPNLNNNNIEDVINNRINAWRMKDLFYGEKPDYKILRKRYKFILENAHNINGVDKTVEIFLNNIDLFWLNDWKFDKLNEMTQEEKIIILDLMFSELEFGVTDKDVHKGYKKEYEYWKKAKRGQYPFD